MGIDRQFRIYEALIPGQNEIGGNQPCGHRRRGETDPGVAGNRPASQVKDVGHVLQIQGRPGQAQAGFSGQLQIFLQRQDIDLGEGSFEDDILETEVVPGNRPGFERAVERIPGIVVGKGFPGHRHGSGFEIRRVILVAAALRPEHQEIVLSGGERQLAVGPALLHGQGFLHRGMRTFRLEGKLPGCVFPVNAHQQAVCFGRAVRFSGNGFQRDGDEHGNMILHSLFPAGREQACRCQEICCQAFHREVALKSVSIVPSVVK